MFTIYQLFMRLADYMKTLMRQGNPIVQNMTIN